MGRAILYHQRVKLPFREWMLQYNREHFLADLIAGVVVTILLVPQSMAYALLAGLPPEVGLYASILPLIIYGLMGTSRTLAVGPVAVVSLLVASGISSLQPATTAEYIQLTFTLALMIGIIQSLMGFFRIGFLVNFLSHPVLSGFTSGAAIIIALSQLSALVGVSLPRSEYFHEIVINFMDALGQINPYVVGLSLFSMGTLLYFKYGLSVHLSRLGINERLAMTLSKTGSLFVVLITTLFVGYLGLDTGWDVAIVGSVPSGLPPLSQPLFDLNVWRELLPIALTISVISYMESISVSKALAAKRRQKIDANQELIALGMANIGASFSGGYPVTGGFSRSMVNFSAGAYSGMASIITAGLVVLTVLFLTPLFYYLPKAVLGAIIVVSVMSLIDVKTFIYAWRYDRSEAISLFVTFVAVLELGIDNGIFAGVIASMGLYLWRTSRPHIAVLGRLGDTEEYRNVLRHQTRTFPHILALRVDESLYFPNVQYLENVVWGHIADNPKIAHLVLVCNAVNFVDTSALEVLKELHMRLAENGIGFYMAEVKGPVMDRLKRIGFVNQMGANKFFLTTHEACETLKSIPTPQL
jgi:SulP family sulfate permease